MRGDGGVQLGACEGAVCGAAARGRTGIDAVYKWEMMKLLESVRVELCKDARRVELCFGDESAKRVSAAGE
jgi:hypothetical protein